MDIVFTFMEVDIKLASRYNDMRLGTSYVSRHVSSTVLHYPLTGSFA